jgi:hypothetical protein
MPIGGLGGAGIGALIQALRGKSIGKGVGMGALIGGGTGALAGVGEYVINHPERFGISMDRDLTPNEILGVGGIGGGLAGGLGGAGIGALIQALRGKSIGKGALIGGGTGALVGAGLGLEGANRYNTDKMFKDVINGKINLLSTEK